MTALLRLIWTGEAGPPKACARLRQVMGLQLTKNRLASGFRPPVRVAAKSGGLAGFVRNEVGVIEYPDGDVYIAAVFTQSKDGDNSTINAVIGQAAAAAVAQLRSRAS
jgi:beta-lactamase class A